MSNLTIFTRQVRSRSIEHQRAMALLADAGLPGQMMSVLRQELDSMIRVIYLLYQDTARREDLIEASIRGDVWSREGGRARVTDKEMVDLSQKLQGWTQSVYKFGCAFIHLSNMHDYSDRDPLWQLPDDERKAILEHCRHYHGGPESKAERFDALVPYLPRVLDKVSSNLEYYLETLEGRHACGASEVYQFVRADAP